MTEATETTFEVAPKPSTRRNGKSKGDRRWKCDQPKSLKITEPIKDGYTPPKKTESTKAMIPYHQPTVRVKIRSGTLFAHGQHPGKEREIQWSAIELV